VVDPLRPREAVAVSWVLDGPTTRLEDLRVIIAKLIASLCERLEELSCGAREVEVVLKRADLEPAVIRATCVRPMRVARHLERLILPKLDRIHLGFGVEAAAIHVKDLGRVGHRGMSLIESARHKSVAEREHEIGVLIDSISSVIGAGSVMRAQIKPSHIPERAFIFAPADPQLVSTAIDCARSDRPTWICDHLMPIEVVGSTPRGAPMSVRWKGNLIALRNVSTPERIDGEWWKGDRSLSEYYRVQLEDGRWWWLMRDASEDRWFVKGMWV
jgi:protein ImuB